MRTPYNGLLPQALSMHNISSSNILNNEHVIEDKKIKSGEKMTGQRKRD